MYVNPFWAGVLATLFVELGALFICAVISTGGKHD